LAVLSTIQSEVAGLTVTPPDVSVVICSHRMERFPWLRRAVLSAESQTLPAARIVIVVDGDAELAVAIRFEFSDRCLVVERPTNGGLSAARNSGLAVVSTPLVAFLDDDAEAEAAWLKELVRPLADPSVLGCGGITLPCWDETPPDWFAPQLLWTVGCSYPGLPTETTEVRNVFGGCAVYRHSLFAVTGGFDERLGRRARGMDGCEETELCLRAKTMFPLGRFLFTPQAVIHHHVPTQRATVRYVLKRSFAEGRSKALVSKLVRAPGSLAPESKYLRSSVVHGIGANLFVALVRWRRAPLCRSVLVALSLVFAGVGYEVGYVAARI
jgi:GT2 family glycosyltransferase